MPMTSRERGAPLEPQAGTLLERTAERPGVWRDRSRWAVHVALLLSGAAALGTLDLLHVRIAYHADVGLVFVALVVVHLVQRRRTLARLATQLVGARTFVERRIAVSDLVLFILTVNMLVSGVVDWGRGAPTQLPLPEPFYRWHLDSGLVLVIYLVVHVWRRRKRLWRSTIR